MLTKKEQEILRRIPKAQSENDPKRPEFPPNNPKFPATPTIRIQYKQFSNLWVKDESHNPTGTHKDRMAWELVLQCRHFLEAKKHGRVKGKLPRFSLISSGNAARAIGTAFQTYSLPKLKVLLDKRTPKHIVQTVQHCHCEIYITDLSKRILHCKDNEPPCGKTAGKRASFTFNKKSDRIRSHFK